MNCKIPFTKDIDFGKKVSEITSISLEHEINVEEGFLKGNFIVSGEFKSHEVSVNKESFSYILPFEIELSEEIDTATVEFMIDDFTYEIVNQNFLRVNIDFNVVASKKEIIEEKEEMQPLFRDAKELFCEDEGNIEPENLIEDTPLEKKEEQDKENDEKQEVKTENVQEEKTLILEDDEEIRNDTINKETEDTIINSVGNAEDNYTTYHIHMVSEGESVETVCTMYHSNINILSEYNDFSELMPGDKLIIPEKNE